MITIRAEGPIQYEDRARNRKKDGHDVIEFVTESQQREIVVVTLEMPQGHVNLEGFAPSQYHLNGISRSFGRYLPEAPIDPSGDSGRYIVEDEWEVSIDGEWWDWAQQAHRYQTERPGMGLLDALNVFLRWDETNTGEIDKAIDRVSTAVYNDMTPVAEMEMAEVREMENQLSDLLDGHDAEIPESYAED